MYEVSFYRDARGKSPAHDFLLGLPAKERGKALRWIGKLESEGPALPRPYADIVRGKMRELRVAHGAHSFRFLYFFDGKRIIITNAFRKKTWRIPINEIIRAERLMADYMEGRRRGEV